PLRRSRLGGSLPAVPRRALPRRRRATPSVGLQSPAPRRPLSSASLAASLPNESSGSGLERVLQPELHLTSRTRPRDRTEAWRSESAVGLREIGTVGEIEDLPAHLEFVVSHEPDSLMRHEVPRHVSRPDEHVARLVAERARERSAKDRRIEPSSG